MAGDEEHDPVRGASPAGLLGAEPGVMEIRRDRRVAAGELAPHPRREPREQHAGDAVPQLRRRRLGDVVEEAGLHQLIVGAERSEDLGGALGVTLVAGDARGDEPDRLPRAVEHQNVIRCPMKKGASATAGLYTSTRSRDCPKKNTASRISGPYCCTVRHEYCCRGGSRP